MMITSSTRLAKEETEKLLKIKEETGITISSLIREAVCDYLEAKEEETGEKPELITLNDFKDMELHAVSTTKQEQDPAIIAKQLDDWLFEEYEETSTEVSSP